MIVTYHHSDGTVHHAYHLTRLPKGRSLIIWNAEKIETYNWRLTEYVDLSKPKDKRSAGRCYADIWEDDICAESPKAEYDAEGNPLNLLAAAEKTDSALAAILFMSDDGITYKDLNEYITAIRNNLRKFIGEGS